MKDKCKFPDGMQVKLDGKNELDPCIYEEIERYENVTVIVSQCVNCGHIDIAWKRQPNTRKIDNID